MTRRFYKRCLLWLLPLLMAQSLVPAGFMLAAGDQGITFGFCPVQSQGVVEMLRPHDRARAHSAHAGHAGHHLDSAGASDAPDDQARSGSCPYALTRTATAHTPVIAITAPSLMQVGIVGATDRPPILQPGPFAPNRIRGPPRHLA